MRKVVLDTNVLVSGVVWGGLPFSVIESALTGAVQLVTSAEIVEEYNRVLRKLLHLNSTVAEKWITEISKIIEIIEPKVSIHDCRDPDDNKFLECAVSAEVYCIISGDKDLLSLRPYEPVRILTVKEFIGQI